MDYYWNEADCAEADSEEDYSDDSQNSYSDFIDDSDIIMSSRKLVIESESEDDAPDGGFPLVVCPEDTIEEAPQKGTKRKASQPSGPVVVKKVKITTPIPTNDSDSGDESDDEEEDNIFKSATINTKVGPLDGMTLKNSDKILKNGCEFFRHHITYSSTNFSNRICYNPDRTNKLVENYYKNDFELIESLAKCSKFKLYNVIYGKDQSGTSTQVPDLYNFYCCVVFYRHSMLRTLAHSADKRRLPLITVTLKVSLTQLLTHVSAKCLHGDLQSISSMVRQEAETNVLTREVRSKDEGECGLSAVQMEYLQKIGKMSRKKNSSY